MQLYNFKICANLHEVALLTFCGLTKPMLKITKCTMCIRAVESEFKSNPIFPIFSDFPILSDFLSDFIWFLSDFFRFLDFSRLLDFQIPQL